ncbi:MAG: hypothetical protein ABSF80_05110 [Chitinispirillaceae bacterium]|jgi:hypothetical protein
MKRSLKHAAVVLLGIGAVAFLVRCGSLQSNESLAGGSGAGNPGGAVVLAMSATVGQNLGTGRNKTTTVGKQSTVIDSSGSITVTDKGGQQIKLTGVTVANVTARFILDNLEKPDSLLSGMHEAPPELSADSHCIVYAGSHEFDAVRGMVDSSIATFRLPIGRYSGVRLGFQDFSSLDPKAPPGGCCSKVCMNGVFLYGGAMHKIIIDINYAPVPAFQNFPFGGGIFTLSSRDTTHLDLQFNAAQWFADVDFAASLGNGSLFFDSTGTLNLTSTPADPCVGGLQSIIAGAFFASGKLVVY